ncbi:hypothetical protein ACFVH7_12385 [Kitasatospora indigofera]|uniref:hypothetical protein n=1 Tax=Kitasatospora indigofera TaxID=67307 RepID=UPI003627738C
MIRHCAVNASVLNRVSPAIDPAALAARDAYRLGRSHAAAVHRHLGVALDLAVALEDSGPPAAGSTKAAEADARCCYQALNAVAEARHAASAGALAVAEAATSLPGSGTPATARRKPAAALPPATRPATASGRGR